MKKIFYSMQERAIEENKKISHIIYDMEKKELNTLYKKFSVTEEELDDLICRLTVCYEDPIPHSKKTAEAIRQFKIKIIINRLRAIEKAIADSREAL